jgi:GAF domain-containing protein
VSALSLMIASPDEPFGVLGALSTHPRAFSQSDVSFVQSEGKRRRALERSRAEERLSDVTEAERRRMARALDDDEAATRPASLRGFLYENLLSRRGESRWGLVVLPDFSQWVACGWWIASGS